MKQNYENHKITIVFTKNEMKKLLTTCTKKCTLENNNSFPFLNISFIRDHEKINTTVFRKDTLNDLYLH